MAVYVYNGAGGDNTAIVGDTGSFTQGSGSSAVPFLSEGKVVGMDHVDDISASFTISAGHNHGVFGPMTIESGFTVTVSTGATFTVV